MSWRSSASGISRRTRRQIQYELRIPRTRDRRDSHSCILRVGIALAKSQGRVDHVLIGSGDLRPDEVEAFVEEVDCAPVSKTGDGQLRERLDRCVALHLLAEQGRRTSDEGRSVARGLCGSPRFLGDAPGLVELPPEGCDDPAADEENGECQEVGNLERVDRFDEEEPRQCGRNNQGGHSAGESTSPRSDRNGRKECQERDLVSDERDEDSTDQGSGKRGARSERRAPPDRRESARASATHSAPQRRVAIGREIK